MMVSKFVWLHTKEDMESFLIRNPTGLIVKIPQKYLKSVKNDFDTAKIKAPINKPY